MPLSDPAPREPIHTRTIACRGYRRADGLWDIEGHLVDTKTYAFENSYRGTVAPGTPVHEMWLRLTIDEEMRVHGVEAAFDHAPFRPCPEIAPNFKVLEGLRIGPGWRGRVNRLLGGVKGCTHLVELLGPLGTVAFQSLVGRRRKTAEMSGKKPFVIDSCHALASDGEVVAAEWPEFHTGPKDGAGSGRRVGKA